MYSGLDLCRQVAQCSSVHGSSAGGVKLWVFGGPRQIQADLLSNWHLTVSFRAWAHGLVRAGNQTSTRSVVACGVWLCVIELTQSRASSGVSTQVSNHAPRSASLDHITYIFVPHASNMSLVPQHIWCTASAGLRFEHGTAWSTLPSVVGVIYTWSRCGVAAYRTSAAEYSRCTSMHGTTASPRI